MQASPGINTKCNLLNLTAADFIVRTAYQMGKTPLLPLFAAGLGANATLLGFIVSRYQINNQDMSIINLYDWTSTYLRNQLYICLRNTKK